MGERQKKPIEDSLADRVKRLREEAALLPPGLERNDLLQQARQAEISLRLIEWPMPPTSGDVFGVGALMNGSSRPRPRAGRI